MGTGRGPVSFHAAQKGENLMERAKQLMEMVAKYESLIYDTADYIWKNPETGYREWKTSAYMEEHFEALGYTLTKAGNIPGFYADLDTGRPGPKIAILGELDSLIVGNHPDADPETHAVHACEGAGRAGRPLRLHPFHGSTCRGADRAGLPGGITEAGRDPVFRRKGGIYFQRLL